MRTVNAQWKALLAAFVTMIALMAVAAGLAWRATTTPADQAGSTGVVDDLFYAVTRDPRYAPPRPGDENERAKAEHQEVKNGQ